MKKTIWINIIGAACVVLAIICIFLVEGVKKSIREENDRFLKLLSTYLPGYDSFDFSRLLSVSDYLPASRPEAPENIVLLLKKGDKWHVHSLEGLSIKDIKSKEDLYKIDVFIFGISQKRSSTYRQYVNGSPAGTVDVETERIDLYYFYPASNGFFLVNTMPYKDLPDKISNSSSYKYDLSDIKSVVEKDLQVKFSTPLWSKILFGVLITTVIVVLVAVVAEKIKNRKKYR